MSFETDLVDFDGILMRSWAKYDIFQAARSYAPNENDVIVAAYPKSGSTWMEYIVHEILNDCCDPPSFYEKHRKYGLHIEVNGLPNEDTDDIKKHLKTHLPFNYLTFGENAKYIHICRNPWDSCVSGYNFQTQFPKGIRFNGTFDEYFEAFISGRVPFSSYFEHTISWLKQSGRENILFVTYEETKNDTRKTVLRVAKFLGEQYFESLNGNSEKLEKLLKFVSFDFMKNLSMWAPIDIETAKKFGFRAGKQICETQNENTFLIDFFKTGKTGYSRTWYTENDKNIMKEMIKKNFSQFPDLLEVWKQFDVEM